MNIIARKAVITVSILAVFFILIYALYSVRYGSESKNSKMQAAESQNVQLLAEENLQEAGLEGGTSSQETAVEEDKKTEEAAAIQPESTSTTAAVKSAEPKKTEEDSSTKKSTQTKTASKTTAAAGSQSKAASKSNNTTTSKSSSTSGTVSKSKSTTTSKSSSTTAAASESKSTAASKSSSASTSVAASSKGSTIVDIAKGYLGTPYVYGTAGPSSFDCSGFTMYVLKKAGISIPRVSKDQSKAGKYVPKDQLQAGDLVFFTTDGTGNISHVGIYTGGGNFIHSPKTGDVVKYSNMSSGYYSTRYITARRFY